MNILIINCILSTAEKGVITRRKSIKDTMICNYAMGFIANGNSVTILASEEFRPTEQEEYAFDVLFFKSRLPRIFKPHLIPWPVGMRRYIKENVHKFDVVITSEVFSIATLLAAGVCKDKLVIWQEMTGHQRMLKQLPSKLWHNVVVRCFMRRSLVVARSLPAMRFVKQYAKNVAEEIVDHGANGTVLYPSEHMEDAFIVVSQLVHRKRVDGIIARFAEFVKKPHYSHFLLNIVGDGDLSDSLKRVSKDLGVERNVIFHGFMSHSAMAEMLRSSRAMLVNTERDLNMVSIAESIASGTPIITNTVPASAEFIAASGAGIVDDDWGAAELCDMADNYSRYHKACIAVRDEVTNDGCATKMLRIYSQWKSAKQKGCVNKN